LNFGCLLGPGHPEHAGRWKERDRLPESLLQVRAGGGEEQNAIGCPAGGAAERHSLRQGTQLAFEPVRGTLQQEPMAGLYVQLRDQRLATVAGQVQSLSTLPRKRPHTRSGHTPRIPNRCTAAVSASS